MINADIAHDYIGDNILYSDNIPYNKNGCILNVIPSTDIDNNTYFNLESVTDSHMNVSQPDSKNSGIFNPELTLMRIKRLDFIVVYSSLLILTILFLVIVYIGENTAWYRSLRQTNINPWLIRGLWVIGTISSYISFFFIWQNIQTHEIPKDLIVSVLYIVTDFLFVAWSIAFYYAESLSLSLWVAVIIFVYNLWLFIYVWNIRPLAALFLIPNMILYAYLMYSGIHLASLNHIPV